MIVYLDASVAVSLFADDAHTGRARSLVSRSGILIVSDLTAGEFSSALAIQYRAGRASEAQVRAVFAHFDNWREATLRTEALPSDLRRAQEIIRTLEYPLKLPDATHIVIARRLGASLATFDATMARSAERLGMTVAEA